MKQFSLFDGEIEVSRVQETIYTAYHGNNDILVQQVMKLYSAPGDKVIDVTYGKGAFWKRVDLTQYDFIGSDLKSGVDFNNLPYDDNSKDIHVLDPPYGRNNTKGNIEAYALTNTRSHNDILKMYESGMKEAYRVLKHRGYSFVKCQDEVHGGKNHYTHIEIEKIARELGFKIKDLFILVMDKKPRAKYDQQHARKNHSYLWILQR